MWPLVFSDRASYLKLTLWADEECRLLFSLLPCSKCFLNLTSHLLKRFSQLGRKTRLIFHISFPERNPNHVRTLGYVLLLDSFAATCHLYEMTFMEVIWPQIHTRELLVVVSYICCMSRHNYGDTDFSSWKATLWKLTKASINTNTWYLNSG